MSLSWVGPSLLAGSVAYVFHLNHLNQAPNAPKPLVSTTSFTLMLFFVYVVGAIPRNLLFPNWWYKGNIFAALYRYGYCSELLGYNVVKRVMHAPRPYPHSDYRGGIRALTEVRAVGSISSSTSSSLAIGPGANLEKWLPPCLADAEASAAGVGRTSKEGQDPRSAAAAAAAALETLQASRHRTLLGDETPAMFALRGGLPVDAQKLKYRKSDRSVLVIPVPIFTDNYSYLIFSCRTKKCCFVDPADPIAAMKCLLYLKKSLYGDERNETEIKITDVLTTHRHWDHAGGNKDLVEYAQDQENREKAKHNENACALELNVYGPAEESAHFVNKTVKDGDHFFVCDGAVRVDVLATPGHTHGSLIFVTSDAHAEANAAANKDSFLVHNRLAVFTGDALFSGGIGAPFETRAVADVQKTRSAFTDSVVLQQHPGTQEPVAAEDVLLYVGHEYTERLVSEVGGLIARCLDAQSNSGAGGTKAAAARESGLAYLNNLKAAIHDIKIMRAQTDGLDDVKRAGEDLVDMNKAYLTAEERERQRQLRHRIPLCTVPSTLALEKKINPLLTVRPETLEAVPLVGGEVDTKELERAIYLSLDRVLR